MNDDLPQGWSKAPLGDLAAPVPNAFTIGPFGSNLKVSDYTSAGVPLVFVRDIRAEKFGGARTKYVSQRKALELASHTARPGDVLVTKMGEPPGDTAVYPDGQAPAIVTADCIKLTTHPEVTSGNFLKYCLRDQRVRSQILVETMGVAQQKLSLSRFKTVVVPIPPLPEQLRIVTKIEVLLGKIRTSQERLDKVRTMLKRFRQAVLAAACDGRLTEDLHRSSKWVRQEMPLGELAAEIRTGPFGSTLHKSDYVSGGIPVINPVNMVEGRIVPSRDVAVSRSTFKRLEDYSLRAGDIIVARRGEMGRCALVTSREAGWLCGKGSAIIRLKAQARAAYIALVVSSPVSRTYLSEASVGTTMDNLNQKLFKAMPIFLPTVEEQDEIVRRVQRLYRFADRLEARYEKARTQVEKLTQSIISKAFRGELVQTEAELARREGRSYETAQELLARIHLSKAGENGSSRPRGRKVTVKT